MQARPTRDSTTSTSRACRARGAYSISAAWRRTPWTARRRSDYGGTPRARGHCHFILPLIRVTPESLTYLVALVLKRQCDRTLGTSTSPTSSRTSASRPRTRCAVQVAGWFSAAILFHAIRGSNCDRGVGLTGRLLFLIVLDLLSHAAGRGHASPIAVRLRRLSVITQHQAL